ncbi:MAG: 2-succinyl-5-enolpyruvyl-6-hydroxy-3-cyclohexene-1-carboxylic-acid synthase [Gammaproteobacteria bacterium]|nr:2-succinyl-5-enolpyruvyl-6-hydroxy-3-cyclohexene-1-carboxylic-acid synthase [Gammaproteobacteria bacterium]
MGGDRGQAQRDAVRAAIRVSAPAPTSSAAGFAEDLGCCNLRWSLALLEGMVSAGISQLVLSPGARSTPLVIAAQRLEQAGRLVLTPVLDERSAGFFALGLARASLQPVALLATSGSAPAHWYPAVIEASESGLPLLLLSADRPPRLHGWGANQTIDQTRLFGAFVREFHDPGPPQSCPSRSAASQHEAVQSDGPGPSQSQAAAALKAQRALGRRAAEVSQGRHAGPVHINLPFDEPLVPGPDCDATVVIPEHAPPSSRPEPTVLSTSPRTLASPPQTAFNQGSIAPRLEPTSDIEARPAALSVRAKLSSWPKGRGLIVCGPGAEQRTPVSAKADRLPLQQALAPALWRCADALALPVLVDPLSGLRTGPGSDARVSAYDAILRNSSAAQALRPDWVLRIGQAPVSKVLGRWLEGVPAILADPAGRWSDPGHDALSRLELPAAAVCEALVAQQLVAADQEWLECWRSAEQRAWGLVAAELDAASEDGPAGLAPLTEGQVVQVLRRLIPTGEALFCGNSMPIRQLDTWWRGGDAQVALLGNRGASGIDGYLSTLAGLSAAGLHCWGLTGDLSFCHDLSGLLLAARLDRPLLVLNNGGGHIFDYLPQNGLPDFERLWQTPQRVSIGAVAAFAGLQHRQVGDVIGLEQALADLGLGPAVIEVWVDPEISRRTHLGLWERLARTSTLSD